MNDIEVSFFVCCGLSTLVVQSVDSQIIQGHKLRIFLFVASYHCSATYRIFYFLQRGWDDDNNDPDAVTPGSRRMVGSLSTTPL